MGREWCAVCEESSNPFEVTLCSQWILHPENCGLRGLVVTSECRRCGEIFNVEAEIAADTAHCASCRRVVEMKT